MPTATVTSLSYQTLISDPIAVNTTDQVPNGDRLMFSPLTTTLITGDRDAVLVDPPMTTQQSDHVGDWIESSQKRLTHIYITHGHGDHWFGAAQLLRRFPGATVLATPGTIKVMEPTAPPSFAERSGTRNSPDKSPNRR